MYLQNKQNYKLEYYHFILIVYCACGIATYIAKKKKKFSARIIFLS